MSPRRLLVAAALATWLAPPALPAAVAQAGTDTATSTTTAAKKKPPRRTTAKRTRREPGKRPTAKQAKRSTRAKATKRSRVERGKVSRPSKRRSIRRGPRHIAFAEPAGANPNMGSNMPAGWAWPPSPAMEAARAACTAKLDELGIAWEAAEPIERVPAPITVPSMTFGGVKLVSWFRKPPFVMDCHLALALHTFSQGLYDLGVRELKFSRIYGYTLVRTQGVTRNILSRHALGLAVDVRAVIDADGREALVQRDYPAGDPLLLAVEEYLNQSGGFRTVLTPKNDPASHHDHFHVEAKVEY